MKPLNPFAQEFHPTATLNPFAAPWPNHQPPQSLPLQHYPLTFSHYHAASAAYYIAYPPPSTQQPITATADTTTCSGDFDLQALRPPPPSPKASNPNFSSLQELRKPRVKGGDLTGKVKFSWKGGFRLSTRGGYCGGGGERSPPTSAGFEGPSSRRRRPSTEHRSVMIRNIPNQCLRQDLIESLDDYCRRENQYVIETKINEAAVAAEAEELKTSPEFAYDFVYLPIDFGTHVNRGFAFVNFTSPIAVKELQLYNSANPKWEKCDSDKLRDIACGKIQGKRTLVDHFDKSVFSCCSDKYPPIFYSRPRDGSSRLVSQRTIGQWIRTTKPPIN